MTTKVYPRAVRVNPFKPEFSIVIFIHYTPLVAVAILDLQWMKMTWVGGKLKKIAMYWENIIMEIFLLKPLVLGKLGLFSGM